MAREPFATPAERSAQAMAKMTPGTLRGASRIATPGRAVGRPKRIPATAPRPFGWTFTTDAATVPYWAPSSAFWISDVTADVLGMTVTATHTGDVPVEFYFAYDYACNYDVVVGSIVTIPPGAGPQTFTLAFAGASMQPDRYYHFHARGLGIGPPDTYLTDVSASVTLAGDHLAVHVDWPLPE